MNVSTMRNMSRDARVLLLTMLGALATLALIALGYTLWKASVRKRLQMALGLLGMALCLAGVGLIAWRQRHLA